MIDKIKVLIGDESDVLVQIYVDRAVAAIKNYLNNDRLTNEYVTENFEEAVIIVVENMYNTKDDKHIKSFSEGKQSTTYFDSVEKILTDEVLGVLPTPYVRMM